MPNTAKGFPYPNGAVDKLADTDLKIKALADFLEARVGLHQSDTDSITTVAATAVGKVITFPTPFPVGSVPKVFAMPITGSPQLIDMSVGIATATQVTVTMYRSTGAGAVQFNWKAEL